jgi:membrane-associated protease RseP (regulator of RpoE activity)
MQTTYFRGSYTEHAKHDAPGLVPHGGATPGFSLVGDMRAKEREMYGDGYAMLGYSQFVGPLLTSLAESYSTKWGAEVGAGHVVLETPRSGASNLHYFLVTYWAARKRDAAELDAYLEDLPPELLERIGKSLNVVIVQQVVKGGAAHAAGLRANDVLLALDGERVMSVQQFAEALGAQAGGEIVLHVSRADKEIELPLRLKAAVRPVPGYREAPWLATQPRDYSMLSAASSAASAVQVAQQQEQQRQLEYARADAQAARNLALLESRRASAAQPDLGRRGAMPDLTGGRRGAMPSPSAGRMPTQEEMSRNYQEAIEKWRQN